MLAKAKAPEGVDLRSGSDPRVRSSGEGVPA